MRKIEDGAIMAQPLPDGAFDLVLSPAVIAHLADAPLHLRECPPFSHTEDGLAGA